MPTLIVKAVIIGLALASLATWTVWLAKSLELRSARIEVRQGLRILTNAPTLAQAHDQLRNGTSPVAQLMQAAGQEIRLSANVRGDGLKERIAWQLERLEIAASRKISRGTGVLATIGSTAPFVGLFGTVWGIMNSFIGISNANTTNLAVVAPGHRPGAAGNRAGADRRDPGGHDLQRAGALDGALSRAPWRRLRAGDAAREPRSRPRQAAARASRRE